MKKQNMERRDFLKGMGSFLLGIICMPFAGLFHEKKGRQAGPAPIKEAMHYTSGDNLAG